MEADRDGLPKVHAEISKKTIEIPGYSAASCIEGNIKVTSCSIKLTLAEGVDSLHEQPSEQCEKDAESFRIMLCRTEA